MQALIVWIKDHPYLFISYVGTALTFITAVLRKVAPGSRATAIFSSLGPDVIKLICTVLGVPMPGGFSPASAAIPSTTEAVAKMPIPVDTKPTSKRPPGPTISGLMLMFLVVFTSGCAGFWTQSKQDAAIKAGADYAACVALKIEAGEMDVKAIAIACEVQEIPSEIGIITAKNMLGKHKAMLGTAPCGSSKVTP